ncbi:MAG TPA: PHP domain-containing protein, partial [Polyangiaceae bacterium]
RGESRHRIAAYERGADVMMAFRGDLDRFIDEGRLTEIPGIGARIASIIEEVRATGRALLLDELREGLPDGALALARGPKLSKRAIATLSAAGIRDVPSLLAAAKDGTLRELTGFTEKTEARILKEAAQREERRGRMVLRRAMALAEDLARYLKGDDVAIVGELRRGLEVIDAIDLLATSEDVRARFEKFRKLAAGHTAEGVPVRLHVVDPKERGVASVRLTGSAAHVAALGDLRGATEEEVYANAGLQWVPPPMREGEGEIALARAHRIPKLIEASDLRGMVHCHTTFSDGADTIEAMARAAEDLGMEFITITDHSPTAHYAHGVELSRLEEQWDAIARAQENVGIRILRGTESDILQDGALDYPDAILEKLDVIIASIHNRYRQGAADMTKRIITALRHPMFKIWGHALGRILLNRPPVECDVEKILDVAAESRVAIELNGDPFRMDMAPHWAKRAHARGIKFVISVDAHSTPELRNVRWGALMAQRAGLAPRDVLNTHGVNAFVRAVRPA